jgi:hypothetical protein
MSRDRCLTATVSSAYVLDKPLADKTIGVDDSTSSANIPKNKLHQLNK